ncbi:MAG: ribbon-helix-helix domain-containing protein [Dyella sp.]|uniref:ribbon-helix-helix domain-containing protein n=1 Tax=Dyella sp. TaxID=1869338 RepID=UPI003F7D4CDC
MSTMIISLPESLKAFVDDQVNERGYGTSSEYVRELIRRDQERLQLRDLLLTGASPNLRQWLMKATSMVCESVSTRLLGPAQKPGSEDKRINRHTQPHQLRPINSLLP